MAGAAHARHGRTTDVSTTSPDAPLTMPTGRWHALPTVVALVACALFSLTLALVLAGGKAALAVDDAALSFVMSIRSPLFTAIMNDVTAIVMPSVLAAATIALCALGHGPRLLVAALVDAGGAVALNTLLKHIVLRPRPPEELRLAVESSTSFPSSHAVTVVAFYGLLAWLVMHYQRPGAWRRTLIALLVTMTLLVGISRIYLAVHYLSDVFAGFMVGTIWLVAYTRILAPRILLGGFDRRRDNP